MTTVIVDKAGHIGLPAEVLQASEIQPGTELVVLAHKGKMVLLDRRRFAALVEKPTQELLAQLRQALARQPQAPFFAGLTLEEYAALSQEEDQALWERLWAAAANTRTVEHDIPAHFRPAGQKRP